MRDFPSTIHYQGETALPIVSLGDIVYVSHSYILDSYGKYEDVISKNDVEKISIVRCENIDDDSPIEEPEMEVIFAVKAKVIGWDGDDYEPYPFIVPVALLESDVEVHDRAYKNYINNDEDKKHEHKCCTVWPYHIYMIKKQKLRNF